VLMMFITEYYTSTAYSPVKRIAKASVTGPATNLISGLAVGMQSTFGTVLVIAVAMFAAFNLAGLYGIAIAAVAMLSVTGMIGAHAPTILLGLLIGGMLPFLFSSFLMEAVGKAAGSIITEVRRQFREIKGIMEGTAKPDYAACVDIVTKAALKEMALPGIVAV